MKCAFSNGMPRDHGSGLKELNQRRGLEPKPKTK